MHLFLDSLVLVVSIAAILIIGCAIEVLITALFRIGDRS